MDMFKKALRKVENVFIPKSKQYDDIDAGKPTDSSGKVTPNPSQYGSNQPAGSTTPPTKGPKM